MAWVIEIIFLEIDGHDHPWLVAGHEASLKFSSKCFAGFC